MKKYLAEFFNKINHFTGETKAKQKRKNEKKKRGKNGKAKVKPTLLQCHYHQLKIT